MRVPERSQFHLRAELPRWRGLFLLCLGLVSLAGAGSAAAASSTASNSSNPSNSSNSSEVATSETSGGGRLLTLDEALRLAESRNPDLIAARARLKQAETMGAKAWAGYLPQVNVGGNYTYNSTSAEMMMPLAFGLPLPSGGFDPTAIPPGTEYIPVVPVEFMTLEIQKQHMFQGNVQLSQNLFAPAIIPLIQNASRAVEASVLGLETTKREILFATAQLYYAAASMKEVAEVQERQLEVTRRHEEDAKLQVQQGTAPRVVHLRARIELASAEQELRRARLAYESSKSALAALISHEPEFEVERPASPQAPEGLDIEGENLPPMNELLSYVKQRPDVQAQQKNVEISEGSRHSVAARYLPNIGAFAQYSLANVKGFTGENGVFTAGIQLSWNILDGGLREAELREASARIAESKAQLSAAEIRAQDEIRRALLDLASARANRVRAEEQMGLAKENASLVRTGFEAGASSYLEVLDANAALTGAELALVSETLNADLAILALARAVGLFDPLEGN